MKELRNLWHEEVSVMISLSVLARKLGNSLETELPPSLINLTNRMIGFRGPEKVSGAVISRR